MEVNETELPGLLLLRPRVYRDERGFFLESWNQRVFDELIGRPVVFVQDNFIHSIRGVLRGLHYQISPHAQGKLISVESGEIFDAVVDLRRESPTFGKSLALLLKATDHTMVWIPPGFAHGFLVLSEFANVSYKATAYYSTQHERCIRWNDPELGINWPLDGFQPLVSAKDAAGQSLRDTMTP